MYPSWWPQWYNIMTPLDPFKILYKILLFAYVSNSRTVEACCLFKHTRFRFAGGVSAIEACMFGCFFASRNNTANMRLFDSNDFSLHNIVLPSNITWQTLIFGNYKIVLFGTLFAFISDIMTVMWLIFWKVLFMSK